MDDGSTFQKLPGTVNRGSDYENWIISDLVLKLVTDNNVKNFKLSSNDAKFHGFDDIVVEIDSTQPKSYAMQLKYGKKDKILTYDDLSGLNAQNNKFSILKYFEYFEKIKKPCLPEKIKKPCLSNCNFILFTNRKLKEETDEKIQIDNDNDNDYSIYVKIKKTKSDDLFSKGRCYKFETEGYNFAPEGSEEDDIYKQKFENYKEFFDNFFLYTDQPNLEDIKNQIASTFQEEFSSSSAQAEMFLQFISHWNNQENFSEKLSKNFIQEVLTLILLNESIQTLDFGKIHHKMKLFREAVENFDVTILKEEAVDNVRKFWGDFKYIQEKSQKEMNDIARKFQLIGPSDDISNLKDKELSKLLWLLKKCPMIVPVSERACKTISLCQNHKFILLTSEPLENQLPGTVFQNLSDMDEESQAFKNIANTFKCSMQGKEEINLTSLIALNEKIKFMITTNDLIKMVDSSYRIGEDQELISKSYLKRFVSRNFINANYLKTVDKDTLIVLDCMNHIDKLNTVLGNFNLMEVSRFLKEEEIKSNEECFKSASNHQQLYHTSPVLTNFVSGPDLYVNRPGATNSADFKRVCQKNPDMKKCHHLKIIDEETLEWIASTDGIDDLERYRREDDFIEETELYNHELDNDVNLLNGDPGMGKSELLKSIKNHNCSEFWGVFLQSKDITLLCEYLEKKEPEEKITELIHFVINTLYKNYPEFDKKLIKLLIEDHQVAYFWDALDEITVKNIDIVTELIQELTQKCQFQWITSRCHLKRQLEKKFNVLSKTIRQFTKEEQKVYIERRLQHLNSKKEIKDAVEKIGSAVTQMKHSDVLGVPLQIFMFTELFCGEDGKNLELLDQVFPLTDLYQHIIDQKFDTYYKTKAEVHSPNDALRQVLLSYKKNMFKEYEKLGLKVLIKSEIFKQLNINCDEFLKEIQRGADHIGLITDVTDNFPQFLHNSYAEFFVAKYFIEHPEIDDKIKIILRDTKYDNIRFFYDLLNVQNNSSHVAVMYKNIDLLKKSSGDLNTCQDEKGRNVLQLACSWGQKCPILDVEQDGQVYIINNLNDDISTGETREYQEMLDYLLENCEDSLSSLSYAENANCLLAKLQILLKRNNVKLRNNNEGISILYYSTKFGYDKAFSLFEKVPLVKTAKDNSSLLHLAVIHNHEKVLDKLLSIEIYKEMIDDVDKNKETPLFKACQNGYYNLVELLLQNGAKTNKQIEDGSTPLHTACLHLQNEIVTLLLRHGADINCTKNFGVTPLHSASWNGHESIVKLLLQNGANINATADSGCTPLYVASRNNHPKVVELLLSFVGDGTPESKARINLPQKDNVTPLFIACQEGHEKNVALLLRSKPDVNICTKSGESPLYIAAQNGHTTVVQMLIKRGADIEIRSGSKGWTPLQIACQQGHVAVVKALIQNKANLNVGSEDGLTPLEVATCNNHHDIVQLLTSRYLKRASKSKPSTSNKKQKTN